MEPIQIDLASPIFSRESIKNSIKFFYIIKCSYCGKRIILNGRLLNIRLKAKYLPSKQSCPSGSPCHKQKQSEINQIRKVEGTCANQGHRMTSSQKKQYVKNNEGKGKVQRKLS